MNYHFDEIPQYVTVHKTLCHKVFTINSIKVYDRIFHIILCH